MELRLSPLTKVNDPRESKTMILAISDVGGYIGKDNKALEESCFITSYLKGFQKRHKVLCFSRDLEKIFDLPEKYRRIYRGYNNPTLWAHEKRKGKLIC